MEYLATALVTVATGTWVGVILFQSAVVAPVVFGDLDTSTARRFLRTLFPRFYQFGLACGTVMFAGLLTNAALLGWSAVLAALMSATSLMVMLQIISLRMVPRINAARDAGESEAARFARLHRLSVALTAIIFVLGLAILSFIGASSAAAWGV